MGAGGYHALPLNTGFVHPVGTFAPESDFKTKV